jgi:hypothetical protein
VYYPHAISSSRLPSVRTRSFSISSAIPPVRVSACIHSCARHIPRLLCHPSIYPVASCLSSLHPVSHILFPSLLSVLHSPTLQNQPHLIPSPLRCDQPWVNNEPALLQVLSACRPGEKKATAVNTVIKAARKEGDGHTVHRCVSITRSLDISYAHHCPSPVSIIFVFLLVSCTQSSPFLRRCHPSVAVRS